MHRAHLRRTVTCSIREVASRGSSGVVEERRSAWLGALVGASAAIASSYVNLRLRRRAASATGLSEQRLGYAEDALENGLGTGLARA